MSAALPIAGDLQNLRDLQARFLDYLLHSRGQSRQAIVGTPLAVAPDRLDIYASAYRLRLIEALGNDYPCVQQLLDEEAFARMCQGYIDVYPSRHFSLRYFGQFLPQFLGTISPYREQPELAEMAAFEWALCDAFDAADISPASVDDLTGLPPEYWPQLRLLAHPSLQRLRGYYPVASYWHAHTGVQALPAMARQMARLDWIVWRKNLKTYYRSLSEDEAWALDAMLSRLEFSAICDGLCQWHTGEAAALRAAQLLKGWLEDELIADVVCE